MEKLAIETDREEDGRWIAHIPALPGVMVYGRTPDDALVRVKALAPHLIADRTEHDEEAPDVGTFSSVCRAEHDQPESRPPVRPDRRL